MRRSWRECRRQLERCRAVYRPNRTLNFFVEARDGHDDYVISLAPAVAAARSGAATAARLGARELKMSTSYGRIDRW